MTLGSISSGLDDPTMRHTYAVKNAYVWGYPHQGRRSYPSTLTGYRLFTVPGYDFEFKMEPMIDLQPSWLDSVISSAARLLALEPNWDSYGAPPIDPDRLFYGLNLLTSLLPSGTPAPAVVPTNSGGVQFEWHTQGIDLELEVIAVGKVNLFYENELTGETSERELAFDLSDLSPAISHLGPQAL